MKLKTMIAKLEKARAAYIRKHGEEPTVWVWDDDGRLELCSGIEKPNRLSSALRPYMTAQVDRP